MAAVAAEPISGASAMNGAPLDRDKLAAVLGMLGSDHAGEIMAAARQAERLRREAKLSWHDILKPVPAPRREREVATVDDALDLCEAYADWLTVWERGFVATLARQRSAASPKQIAILDQIVTKLRSAEARAA